MSNHGFGLLNIISSIINEERDGNDVAIARYLISNLRNSEAINVSAITERAHVTRSAVRRFCNRLGYQSLSELKNSFSQLVFPSDFRHRDPNLSFNEYRAELDIRMMEMYAEVESRISDALLDELAYEIAQHRNVELLCTNNVSGNLMRFQQEMFFAGNRELITGMVLEFSVPAAVVGMMWVSIYKGDSSITLSLLVIDTVLAPLIIPLTLKILVGARVKMNPEEMMKDLVFMIALPALLAMCLNQFSCGKVKEKWPGKLAFWSKLCLIYCVICNSSKVAPYVRHMNLQRVFVAVCIMILAAAGYAIGWGISVLLKQDEKTRISMIYGSGMRNISAGAVIAAAYFPGEVMFPVMIGTLFQQVLAACYGSLIKRLRNREKGCKK